MVKGTGITTTVTTTAGSKTLLAANNKRSSAEFINRDATITVYLCSGGAAATSDHIPLLAGQQYIDKDGTSQWTVIPASGTPKVCVTEYTER